MNATATPTTTDAHELGWSIGATAAGSAAPIVAERKARAEAVKLGMSPGLVAIAGAAAHRAVVAAERHWQEEADEQDAIAEGRAWEVRHCYVCALEAGHTGNVDNHTGPFRQVLHHITVNVADPTAAYQLACEHTVIDL